MQLTQATEGAATTRDADEPTIRKVKNPLDWRALQKALVFTKLVYRKPAADAPRKPARPPVPSAEHVAAAAAALNGSGAPDPLSPTAHVDAFGTVEERLLPWACD